MSRYTLSVRVFVLPQPGGFALARRGVIKLWTRAAEARLMQDMADHAAIPSQGLAELGLVLEESGAVAQVKLDQPGPWPALEQACLNSLRAIAPLPPPPPSVMSCDVVVQLEFTPTVQTASNAA
jgi:hypothetical protein